MLIRIGYEIVFNLQAHVPMMVMLDVRPEHDATLRGPGSFRVSPSVPVERYLDPFGNRCGRLLAPPGEFSFVYDGVIEDDGQPDVQHFGATQAPIEQLPAETLPFLLGSRYCEVDRLSEAAWNLFGNTAPGWSRVQAVCDWVHSNVKFGYHFARPTKTAHDVFLERTGVCRDFNHLALTFCRCLGIPARYVTGYLGDIGVPPQPCPMDFSGWFEAYLDGRWYAFDARHSVPRIGRIVIGRGRDAVDVAMTTAFGPAPLQKFRVWTDEIAPGAQLDSPLYTEPSNWQAGVSA